MNNLSKTKHMKKLLGLLLIFTGMVYAQPAITNPQDQTLFDQYNDNNELFLVYDLSPQILGSLNASDYTIVFSHDADFQNIIPMGQYVYYANNETVYVKVTENANPGNVATAIFSIFLVPIPVIGQGQNMFQTDIPFDAVGTFDLTSQSAAIINGLTGVALAYYPTAEDAAASTNEITNPSAYTSITNPQNIFAKVTIPATGSYSLSQFRIVLNSIETVTVSDPYFKTRVLERYDYNSDSVIQMSEALSVTYLDLANADIWTQPVYDLTGIENFPNVTQLFIGRNPLGTVDLSALTNLEHLDMASTNATSLNVTGLTHLKSINCDTGQLTSLDVSTCTDLETLMCARNHIASLNMSGLTGIQFLYCNENQLTTLDVSAFTNLSHLCCSDNALTTLDLTGLNQIISLCYGNQSMGVVDTSQLTNLYYFGYGGGAQTELDFTNMNNLENVWVWNSNVTDLDLSNSPSVNIVRMINNANLTHVNMKNGGQFLFSPNPMAYDTEFRNNPNLLYVCTNESDQSAVNNALSVVATDNGVAHAGTYCSFTPGGDYNSITGIARFDADNNGCDTVDIALANVRIDINDGAENGSTFTNQQGNYTFYTEAGNFTLTPNFENPSWFNFTPSPATISFADDNNNETTQNFCMSANGVHNDVEVVLSPLSRLRPGFDCAYQLVYKNKGNQTLSGNVNLIFDGVRLDFVSASPAPDNQASSGLTWNYVNLLPFETRTIDLILNANSPVENPPVNNGDTLSFTAAANPIANDELPEDNIFELNQTAVNSYDPNEKTCLEGDSLSPQQIGKYLHYTINFENLGTSEAVNVVVRDSIDVSKFDISSLQVIHASNEVVTKIKGNVVEFVFSNINLAPLSGDPPVGGHGSILFKIRTLSTLTHQDEVSNEAGIYFDYNAPVATNAARTHFSLLNTSGFKKDESIVLHPNPAKDFVKINSDNVIQSIAIHDVQGRILETATPYKHEVRIDISSKSKGIYFIAVTTATGKNIQKIIKQ